MLASGLDLAADSGPDTKQLERCSCLVPFWCWCAKGTQLVFDALGPGFNTVEKSGKHLLAIVKIPTELSLARPEQALKRRASGLLGSRDRREF